MKCNQITDVTFSRPPFSHNPLVKSVVLHNITFLFLPFYQPPKSGVCLSVWSFLFAFCYKKTQNIFNSIRIEWLNELFPWDIRKNVLCERQGSTWEVQFSGILCGWKSKCQHQKIIIVSIAIALVYLVKRLISWFFWLGRQ